MRPGTRASGAFFWRKTLVTKILESLCGWLAGLALFAIMTLTFFDVSGRKLLSNSITGSLELTELLMVVVIFSALPLVSLRGEHVVFDSLDRLLPPALRAFQQAVIHLLCASALLGLAWLMWETAQEFWRNGETTAQLHILKAPFIFGMSLMCALTGIVHLMQLQSGQAQTQPDHDGGVL